MPEVHSPRSTGGFLILKDSSSALPLLLPSLRLSGVLFQKRPTCLRRSPYFYAMHINFECKARCGDIELAERKLLAHDPDFKGEDHQVDTYFNVPHGRLKLREGNIENALIHYFREDVSDAKQSTVLLYHPQPGATLKQILATSLGIKTVVDKRRKIYFIGQVKFHFDRVEGLGNFVEIEAIDKDGSVGLEKLKQQCNFYIDVLGIQPSDHLAGSYSDMIEHPSSAG
jgi:adenylate cyclase class 2